MPAMNVVRRRLEAQGFVGLDDVALAEIGPWLRWSPALCAVFMAAGTILASAPVLWALAVIAALGALYPLLGGMLAIVAAMVGVTHFCIPSLVYNKLFRRNAAARACVARGA